jgi:hypothetical protein
MRRSRKLWLRFQRYGQLAVGNWQKQGL